MAFIDCGGGGGDNKMSSFKVLETTQLIDFLNDERFTCTDNGYPWTQKDVFQYEETNMWSPPYVPDRTAGIETIVNNTDKSIFFKVAWETSCENADVLRVIINNEVTIVAAAGVHSGVSNLACVPPGEAIILSYTKDTSATQGKDNVGIILYEIMGV